MRITASVAITLLALALVPVAADTSNPSFIADDVSIEINVLETIGVYHKNAEISLTMADGDVGGFFAVQNPMYMWGNVDFKVFMDAGEDIAQLPEGVDLWALVNPTKKIRGTEYWTPSAGGCHRFDMASGWPYQPGNVGSTTWARWHNTGRYDEGGGWEDGIATFTVPTTGEIDLDEEVIIIYGLTAGLSMPRVTDPEDPPTVTMIFTVTPE